MSPKAPPLTGNGWLNTVPPPGGGLQGRVTVLLFWSPSCEASIARLREIEVVLERSTALRHGLLGAVGVLSPRHHFERSPRVAADAVDRLGVSIPVVHDPDLEIWSRYGPGGWPTTIVVDHRGRALGAQQGLDDLDVLVEAARLAVARAGCDPRRQPPAWPTVTPCDPVHARERSEIGPWSWPSGVAVLPDGSLAIVDSGHDRVVIVALDRQRRRARVRGIVEGLPRPGRVTSWGPSGLAVSLPDSGQVVGVDRRAPQRVELVADGLGRPQGLTQDRDGTLVVCDATDEQLVRIHGDSTLGVVAGIGFTGHVDGPAGQARLAQPVGITRTASGLAFVDAGSSNLRLLTDSGRVMSVTHNSFERAGLVDGPAHRAVLQRPSSLAVRADGAVLVADTGNDRIRVVAERRVRTLGLAGLCRPEDVAAFADGTIVIADTGNHRIVMADPDARSAWALELLT